MPKMSDGLMSLNNPDKPNVGGLHPLFTPSDTNDKGIITFNKSTWSVA